MSSAVPSLKRREVTALLDYIGVARRLDEPLGCASVSSSVQIANMPNRRLPTSDVRRAANEGVQRGWSPRRVLSILADDKTSILPGDARDRVNEFALRLDPARGNWYAKMR